MPATKPVYGVARIGDTIYLGRITTNYRTEFIYITGYAADIDEKTTSFIVGTNLAGIFLRDAGILLKDCRKERVRATNDDIVAHMNEGEYRGLLKYFQKM